MATQTRVERKAALTAASKEYYARMKMLGYKKYGIMLKVGSMEKIGIIANQLNVPKFQLLDKIIDDYIKSIEQQGADKP